MPTSFSHEIYEPESEIIILSDNGYIEMERDIYFVGDTVKIESGVTFYSNSNEYNIDIQAEEDITVESGVVFETDHNKSDISLLSNSGNIVINGVDFSVNQNSNHNTIDISAPEGSVYMQGTKLKATREISVEAKENIFAGPNDDNNAEIIVTQSNEDIRFTISELTGKICVTDLKLDYGNAGSAIATPINNVCGILHEESKCIQGYTPQECN
jgi:hypothetical protein